MMPLGDLIVAITLTIFLIVGVYQFYFLTQNHMIKPAKQFNMKIDTFFKFKGYWVWLYSGLYYPMIIATVLTIDNMRQYNYSFMSFVFLLFIQLAFFRYYPVETPAAWRDFSDYKQTRSVRLCNSSKNTMTIPTVS